MENERKWRRIRFAKNLAALIEGTGLSRKQFAGKAEIPYPWLQRATTGGITRLDRRGRDHLEVIARSFGLPDLERLWDRDFVIPPPWGTREARAARIAEDLRWLMLDDGEDVEPLKTIVRLIGEAKVRAKEGGVVATSGTDPASERPVVPDERRGTAPPFPPPAQGVTAGLTLAEKLRGMRSTAEGHQTQGSNALSANAPTPSKATGTDAGPTTSDDGRCVDCKQPADGRCRKCGRPSCRRCLRLWPSCTVCRSAL